MAGELVVKTDGKPQYAVVWDPFMARSKPELGLTLGQRHALEYPVGQDIRRFPRLEENLDAIGPACRRHLGETSVADRLKRGRCVPHWPRESSIALGSRDTVSQGPERLHASFLIIVRTGQFGEYFSPR